MKANLANYSGGAREQVLMGHLEFVHKGITSTMAVKADWERVPIDEKIQIFLWDRPTERHHLAGAGQDHDASISKNN